MDLEQKKTINAKEARDLANTSVAPLNHIYKAIKETAKYGGVFTGYYWDSVSGNLLQTIVDDLRKNGFSVYCYIENEQGESIAIANLQGDHKFTRIQINW